LVEGRQARRVRGAVVRRVGVRIGVVVRGPLDRRVGIAGDEAKTRAELPARAQAHAADGREDVALIEVERPEGITGSIAALALAQRVGEPPEERPGGARARHDLDPVDATDALGAQVVAAGRGGVDPGDEVPQ
jgi:hypothetical protein